MKSYLLPSKKSASRIILLGIWLSVCTATGYSKPANVVLIMADDMGYECVGAYGGSSYETPHLDRLAEEGMRFDHCYSTPICTASRVQIMTGKYNIFNYTRFAHINREEKTFAHLLKERGYATCIAGKWQLGRDADAPQHFGFDTALLWQHTRGNFSNATQTDTRYENPRIERNGVPENYSDGEFGPDLMVKFIGEFIETHKDQPFLVYYPMLLPHSPFVPNPDSEDWNPDSPGAKKGTFTPEHFDDMIHYVDKMVGAITDQLEASGVLEDTYIIFTSDNGTLSTVTSKVNDQLVKGGKGRMTDAGTRVPMLVRGPKIDAGLRSSDLVDFTDVLPTLCAIADRDVPKKMESNGHVFLPQLRQKGERARDYVYCWYKIPDFMIKHFPGIENQSFARTQRYKLYRSGEFYDLQNDVREKRPLALRSERKPAIRAKEMLQTVINKYEARAAQ